MTTAEMRTTDAGRTILDTPFQLTRNLTVPNRIVLAPMGVGQSETGVPNDVLGGFYARRARHGVGLIITSSTFIDHPAASNHPLLPSIASNAAQDAWRRIVDGVHADGGRIFVQLMHAGGDRDPAFSLQPDTANVSPSGTDGKGHAAGIPMTADEITSTIAAFANSARAAREIGFDGVEIHGAHGYLIDQFFWPITNQRTDEYSAGPAYARAVVEAVREAVGPDYPIAMRLSQWKMHDYDARIVASGTELAELAEPLVAAGVDIMHISTRRYWTPAFAGSDRTLASWTRELTKLPTIGVGSVGLDGPAFHSVFAGEGARAAGIGELEQHIQAQHFDLVAVGRALLGDAAWWEKIRDGRSSELHAFDAQSLFELH